MRRVLGGGVTAVNNLKLTKCSPTSDFEEGVGEVTVVKNLKLTNCSPNSEVTPPAPLGIKSWTTETEAKVQYPEISVPWQNVHA